MIIIFSGKINTCDAEEEEVFAVMKQFLTEQFQDYEFSVSGKKETFRHEQKKEEKKEEIKEPEEKPSKQNKLNNSQDNLQILTREEHKK